MSELEEKKLKILAEIQDLDSELTKKREVLRQLAEMHEIKTSELLLFMDIHTKAVKHTGEYEEILGGDGRSRPYSRMVEGEVVDITIADKIFLSKSQLNLVLNYYKDKYPEAKDYRLL